MENGKETAWKWIDVAVAAVVAVAVVGPAFAFQIPGSATFTCIPSGDQRGINARLNLPGDVAVLCSGAVFELTAPVVYSANGQQVYTEGLPTDDRRAVLRLASRSTVTAVFMMDRSGVVLSNVIVDGNRPHLGPSQGDALIQAGGSASGQVIREVRAFETRSWSTIHLFEGGAPRCTDARVENSQIGPAGRTDGSWADGISFACPNSVARNNTIVDATDGGIVIFGAPGSLIENNVIRAENRTLLGGINMVDFHPTEGDYTGTRVHGNVIDAAGAVIRIGLGMGYRVWVCLDSNEEPTDHTLFGAVVTENTLRGDHMQYGFAVDGVRDWTVTDNMDLATHSGTPTVDCRGRVASSPSGFQYHSARAQGVFQSEFIDADLELALWAIEEPRPGSTEGDATPLDATNPSIEITSPRDGAVLASHTVEVAGTASDNIVIQKVELSLDGTSWVEATGTTTWNGTLILADGVNTIHALATDTSGNVADTFITVSTTIAPSPPWLLVGVSISAAIGAVGAALFVMGRRRRHRR